MSRHHRTAKHTTKAPKVREQIYAMLPQRCVDCPHPVTTAMRWQVGHRVPASQGGQTTIANCGPSHTWCPWCERACNQSAGGALGARRTNSQRAATSRASRGLRRW